MGFLNRDKWVAVRYTMREKVFDIGDDYWIETEQGEKVFKVNGKALSIRDALEIENSQGRMLYRVEWRKLGRDNMAIERDGGDTIAKVKKGILPSIGERYRVDVDDGEDFIVKGSIMDREYKLERDGDKVAEISKKRFKMHDTYGIEIGGKQDDALIIAICVCVEQMSHGGEDDRHDR
jgi:uncharacterized protein YxjI